MKYSYTCKECDYSEEGYNSEDTAEHSALEHLAYTHGYTVTAHHNNGDYAYERY